MRPEQALFLVGLAIWRSLCPAQAYRLTCMGFLVPLKGCMLGQHDFASVSGLAMLVSHCLPLCWLLWAAQWLNATPTLGALGRMVHASFPTLLFSWLCRMIDICSLVSLVSHLSPGRGLIMILFFSPGLPPAKAEGKQQGTSEAPEAG